jgi:hypothetical protein
VKAQALHSGSPPHSIPLSRSTRHRAGRRWLIALVLVARRRRACAPAGTRECEGEEEEREAVENNVDQIGVRERKEVVGAAIHI